MMGYRREVDYLADGILDPDVGESLRCTGRVFTMILSGAMDRGTFDVLIARLRSRVDAGRRALGQRAPG